MWSAVSIDVVALVVIAIVMIVTHLRYIHAGISFNDPTWYFHFGHRTLQGDVPYRDYIFQVGPLPIYVDAGFQEVFGPRYVASLYASLLIKLLRVFVVWAIVRRIANARAAAALCVFCAIDPTFGFAHHWSTAYAQLFLTTSGLMLLLASRAEGRRALVLLACAGLSAALVVSARQSTAVMVGVVMFPATAILLYRKEFFTPRRFIAFWGGFAAGMVIVFGALAIAGALGPAIQQMFLDAPQKKNVTGLHAILDAISGGALVQWDRSWWGGYLTFLGIPTAIVVICGLLLARERELSSRGLAVLVVVLALLLGIFMRVGSVVFEPLSDQQPVDLMRMSLTAASVLAVFAPERTRRWLGVEPIVVLGFGALPLASDWALEMSFPGRGWGDAPSLLVGVLLIVFASSRLAPRAKTWCAVAFAAVALLHFGLTVRTKNPLAKREIGEGGWGSYHTRSTHPMLRGIKLDAGRAKMVEWLSAQIPRGSTCFIYGNMPVLYDLIGCRNPTRVDSTAADFLTAGDAEAALAILRASPPDFLIGHEKQWMSPPLTEDLGGDLARYDSLNPKASMALHVGLRAILARYEPIGLVSEALGPELSERAAKGWDAYHATRIYKRRAP